MSATIEPWVRDIMRCPVGLHPLVDATDAGGDPVLVCAEDCGRPGRRRQYRFQAGIPVLLAEDATVIDAEEAGDGSVH